jgi:hypothetical protein
MARVTHVKRAQQRYATVPVIDPETGQPKRVPVFKKGTDVRRTSKSGREQTMLVTRQDRDRPLPPHECDSCRKPIEVGTPYKWIAPKSGPYGGRRLNRHEHCPTWNVWEYSSSLSARLAQISHDFWTAFDGGFDSQDDVTSMLESAADEIEALSEEKRESAQNIEDGFGHPTSASEELEDTAQSLEDWAQEVRDADVPDTHDQCDECEGDGKTTCDACNGTGDNPDAAEDETAECEPCEGTGQVDCAECEGSGEPGDSQMDTWRDEVRDAVAIVDESPV